MILDEGWLLEHYRKREEMVPMRDGVRLFTAIYEPVEGGIPLKGRPVIMTRTPFGTDPYGEEFSPSVGIQDRNYAFNSYIIVYQCVRGSFMSEGSFANVRPLGKGRTDEATDTFDTAEWLLSNTGCNGNIGVKGISYPGFYATIAGLCGHPAIKAVSPQAPVTDWFRGDDMHRNGAFMLADMYGFGGWFFRRHRNPTMDYGRGILNTRGDIYEFFRGKSMQRLLGTASRSLPFLATAMRHPNLDRFWNDRNPSLRLKDAKAAFLVVGGEFDAEDCYGPLETYRRLMDDSSADVFLSLGPWYHGAWKKTGYDGLDSSFFGRGTSDYFLDRIEYPFFAKYLEGKGPGPARVTAYPSMSIPVPDSFEEKDRGPWDDRWLSLGEWPPKGTSRKTLLFGKDLVPLSSAREGKISWVSDPFNPVPYYESPTEDRDRGYMAGDQGFASLRDDVISFHGSPVKDSTLLVGPVEVHLKVATTGTDADFIVKLIDDASPDGRRMLIRADVMPARFREGFSKPRPTLPGKAFELSFTMNDICHELLPGHSLEVQVQGSWFPLVAMNPQTFLANPFRARRNHYAKAEHTLFPDGSWIKVGTVG